MTRLLVLGGAAKSRPLVDYAARHDIHVVLCDRDPEAPCRALAHEFHEVSTLDVPALVDVARERQVDGVVSFASDRMAESAAEVAAHLGLPGNPPAAVRDMGRKDAFRQRLRRLGLPTPRFWSFDSLDDVGGLSSFSLPVVVKPVDGAGSTAVSRVDRVEELPLAFNQALEASREGRVVVEEFVERDHPHVIGGDIFVAEGKVVYWGLLNSHRVLPGRPFLPTGTSWPLQMDPARIETVRDTVRKVTTDLGLGFGGFNVELVFDAEGRLHVLEVAARNGGNAIPDLLERATDVNLIGALVEASLGRTVRLRPTRRPRFVANYMLHSTVKGIFRELWIAPELERWVTGVSFEVEKGDRVRPFDRAPNAVGTVTFEFPSAEEQERALQRLPEAIRVEVEPEVAVTGAQAAQDTA